MLIFCIHRGWKRTFQILTCQFVSEQEFKQRYMLDHDYDDNLEEEGVVQAIAIDTVFNKA